MPKRMPGRNFLFVPGPTNVPDRVQRAMMVAMEDHRSELRRVKPTALLINTARGGLVDELALAQALKEGWIGGAGCDVLTREPPKEGNPLLELRLPNFILTPHIAWASDEAMQFLADQLIDNIEAFVGGSPRNLVPKA